MPLDRPGPQLPAVCFAPQPPSEAEATGICGKPAAAGGHTCAAHKHMAAIATSAQRVTQLRMFFRWLQLRWLRVHRTQCAEQQQEAAVAQAGPSPSAEPPSPSSSTSAAAAAAERFSGLTISAAALTHEEIAASASSGGAQDAVSPAGPPEGTTARATTWGDVSPPSPIAAAVATRYHWCWCGCCLRRHMRRMEPAKLSSGAWAGCECSICIAAEMAAAAAAAAGHNHGVQQHEMGACSDPSNCCACLTARVASVVPLLQPSAAHSGPVSRTKLRSGDLSVPFDWAVAPWLHVFFPLSKPDEDVPPWIHTGPCDGSQRTDPHKGKCLAMLPRGGLCTNKVWIGEVLTSKHDFPELQRHFCLQHLLCGKQCLWDCKAEHHLCNYHRALARVDFTGGLECLKCVESESCCCNHNMDHPGCSWLQYDYLHGADSEAFVDLMQTLYP